MEEVGVEAIVAGLVGFLGDIDKVGSAISGLKAPASDLEAAFGTVTDVLAGFGREILNVAETALGMLLRDAIDWAIGQLKDLAQAIYDAGSQFQTLSLRLQGINLQDAINSGMDYVDAMNQAIDVTKEELLWMQEIAVATPFNLTDIANIYTLARTYGFTNEEAQKLTMSVNDFTAGMGLTGDAAERVTRDFGMMISRGKITTQVMTYMARGAFVPIADLEERMAKNMGITVQELVKMISTTQGVPADEFVKAFEEMTGSEERFIGASGRLGRTFQAAGNNIIDLIRSIGGLNIMKPILDVLGSSLASFVDQFVLFDEQGNILKTKKWDALVDAASKIGEGISKIITGILNLMPSTETIANILIGGVQGLASWIDKNGPGVVEFFRQLKDMIFGQTQASSGQLAFQGNALSEMRQNGIQPTTPAFSGVLNTIKDIKTFADGLIVDFGKITDWIDKNVIPRFDQIKKWITDNKPLIDNVFGALGNIVNTVVSDLLGTGGKGDRYSKNNGLAGFLATIQIILQWVIDHQTEIATFTEDFIKIAAAIEAAKLASGLLFGFLSNIISLDTTAIAAFFAFVVSSLSTAATEAWSLFSALGQIAALGGGGGNTYVDPRGGGRGKTNPPGFPGKDEIYIPGSSSIQNYNLTINSNANSENVGADFRMLASLA